MENRDNMDSQAGAQPSGNSEKPFSSGKGVVTPTSTLVDPKVRCDRCNAACAVRVILPSGAELAFCRHHANKHKAALAKMGALIEG